MIFDQFSLSLGAVGIIVLVAVLMIYVNETRR